MKREFERLAGTTFDLLVIGGGIYGAWIAYDAALRGLQVALVEKTDWAAGTSSASSKLIHGGLRYLEYGRFGLVKKALAERKLLSELGPHRVQPLEFLLPVRAGERAGRLRLKAGLWLYDRLAGTDQPVEPHKSLSRADTLERCSFISPDKLKGSFTFGDCVTDDARLTLEIVAGALEAGAVAVNRATVSSLLLDGARVSGARISDSETGQVIESRARITLNCTGPWVHKLFETLTPGAHSKLRLSKGVHLTLPPLPTSDAFVLPTRAAGRVIFLVPWYGVTLLGTTDTDYRGDPAAARVEPRDIAYLLGLAARFMQGAHWEERDVIGSFAGLRALPVTGDRSSSSVTREWFLLEQAEGLIASLGGKLTSARVDAATAVDRVLKLLGRERIASPTADLPLPWCPTEDFAEWHGPQLASGLTLGIDELTADSCVYRFGTRIDELYALVAADPSLARRIVPEAPFCMAEIAHAVRGEMALSLEDILRRRIPLLLVSNPTEERLREAAELAGSLLGWSESRLLAELQSIR